MVNVATDAVVQGWYFQMLDPGMDGMTGIEIIHVKNCG